MRKKLFMSFLTLLFIPLVACSNNNNNAENNLNDELLDLKVEFDVPESIEVGETLELKAIVTYGDEKVTDADDVNFEYWEEGNKDDSEKVDAKNNEDGTYTADVTFDDDAVIVMYAHTTARDLHTMPKRTVIVGDAVSEENEDRKSTRLNSSHVAISYAVFCLKKKIQLRPKDVKQSNSNMNSYEGPFQTTND